MKGYVYKITNDINTKVYVGITIQKPQVRFYQHTRGNLVFDKVMHQIGSSHFSINILQELQCDNKESLQKQLLLLEKEYILKENCLVPFGYNISEGGNGYIEYYEGKYRKLKKQYSELEYLEEPIIFEGIVYNNIIDCYIKLNNQISFIDIYYRLWEPTDNTHYINEEKLVYLGECIPSSSTFKDIRLDRAVKFVSLPISDNEAHIEQLKQTIESQNKLINKLLEERNIPQSTYIM